MLSLAVVLLLVTGSGWYLTSQELSTTAQNFSAAQRENKILSGRLNMTSGALNQAIAEKEALLENYTRSQGSLNAPGMNQSVIVWTIPSTVPGRQWEAWELLDTFVNQIDIQTNATAIFQIMTLDQFASFYFHYTYFAFVNYTGIHFMRTESLTQGCGVYVLVIINPTFHPLFIDPNVTARYAPTPFLTGTCGVAFPGET